MKMKTPLIILCVIVASVSMLAAVQPAGNLVATCSIENSNYLVSVRNSSSSPVSFWVIPSDEPKSPFFKVPIGAEVFISSAPYTAEHGVSSSVLVSQGVTLPVKMSRLEPGKLIEYRFKLSDLWSGVLGSDIQSLRESHKKFLVRVKVYLNDSLKECIICESGWSDFNSGGMIRVDR